MQNADALIFSERDLGLVGAEESYEIKKYLHEKRKEQISILWNDEVDKTQFYIYLKELP